MEQKGQVIWYFCDDDDDDVQNQISIFFYMDARKYTWQQQQQQQQWPLDTKWNINHHHHHFSTTTNKKSSISFPARKNSINIDFFHSFIQFTCLTQTHTFKCAVVCRFFSSHLVVIGHTKTKKKFKCLNITTLVVFFFYKSKLMIKKCRTQEYRMKEREKSMWSLKVCYKLINHHKFVLRRKKIKNEVN
mgnify:CR=1 FL=1